MPKSASRERQRAYAETAPLRPKSNRQSTVRNKNSELVTYITAGDQVKLYSPNPNEANCLQVNVFDGETLTIGSKGFECDFSCGERWQDSNFAMAPDSRTGFTKAALEPGQLGLVTSFTLFSQPDLETHDARGNTHNDYKMTVTVQEL